MTGPKILIFSTPRVGSNLLARMLSSTRVLGNPDHEHPVDKLAIGYGAGLKKVWPTSWQQWRQNRSHPDGSFCTFIGMDYLHVLQENLPAGAVPKWLGEFTHFIHMRRNDIDAQAVSWDIAIQQGTWHSREAPKRTAPLEYNYERLAYRYAKLHGWNGQISAFIDKMGLFTRHIIVTYERYIANMRGTVDFIVQFAGKQLPTDWQPEPYYERQVSDEKTEMVRKFREGIRHE